MLPQVNSNALATLPLPGCRSQVGDPVFGIQFPSVSGVTTPVSATKVKRGGTHSSQAQFL